MKSFIAFFVILSSLTAAAESLYIPTASDLVNCKEEIVEMAENVIAMKGLPVDGYKLTINAEKRRLYMTPKSNELPFLRGRDIYLLERQTCNIKFVVDPGGAG